MIDAASMTKAALIEEVERLRKQYEECAAANGNSGKFDEQALFDLADGAEGDELFLVTETGRFVFVNDAALDMLGYTEAEMLAMSMPAIDPNNSRAAWLGMVSRLKQSDETDEYETEHVAKDGSLQAKEITAMYVTYRSRNYVLCIGKRVERTEEQRSAAAPAKSKEKVLMQTTSDGVLVVDTRGSIIESNSAADRLLGVAKSEIIGRSCVDSRWRLMDADGSPLSISNHPLMITLVEEQPLTNRRVNMLATDGTRRMLMINASPIFDEAGDLTGAIGCIRPYEDSDERKDLQQRETRQNNIFRDVVHAVFAAGSEDDLERQVCEALVRHGDIALAWRGVTKDTDERIHPTVSAGEASDYLMKIKVRYDDSESGNGPYGRAMKSGKPVVVSDLTADESYEPWRRQAERMGLHSLASFPLQYEGDVLGLFTVYSRDRNHFVGAELDRLTEIAKLLTHGIWVRRRLEHARGARSEIERQRLLLEAYGSMLPVAIARFDSREPFRCEHANSRFSELIDEPYRSTGVEGTFVSDFMFAAYQRDLYQQMQRAASDATVVGGDDDVFVDWQGQQMHWSWRIIPVTGAEGSEQLLYVAHRLDAASSAEGEDGPPSSTEHTVVTSPASEAGPKDDMAILRLSVPRFSGRAKAETRLARFIDEGKLLQANGPARRLFGLDGVLDGEDTNRHFADTAQELLMWLFMLKDSGETISLTLQGESLRCHAYMTSAEGTLEYLLLCE
jgi:PAS domain S-box-containing protein